MKELLSLIAVCFAVSMGFAPVAHAADPKANEKKLTGAAKSSFEKSWTGAARQSTVFPSEHDTK